ncbi:hypothetical protein Pla52n_34360 [Stieleria varia]|uniref:Uncharacterized protein n=2 Tax=Stieleria varia TaxID=2528005 RepID=A0A5C6ATJ6_9BACT|nr:hypothetical protein Pla52n_34360 [Stieleria varia]
MADRADEDELTVEIYCGIRAKVGSGAVVYGGEFRANFFRPVKYYRVTKVTDWDSAPLLPREQFVQSDSIFVAYDSDRTVVIDVPKMTNADATFELKSRVLRLQPDLAESCDLERSEAEAIAEQNSSEIGEQ